MRAGENRGAERYRVSLPVRVETGGDGLTRDMSTSGVYFETDGSFSPSAPISFSLVMAHGFPGGPTRIRCDGQIVRVDRREGKVGVAASITSYQFEPLEPWRAAE